MERVEKETSTSNIFVTLLFFFPKISQASGIDEIIVTTFLCRTYLYRGEDDGEEKQGREGGVGGGWWA